MQKRRRHADIFDAFQVAAREILVHGRSFGAVTLVVWSKAGQDNFYNITVEQDLEPLGRLLKHRARCFFQWLHHPGAVDVQDGDQHRTRRRPELRDRGLIDNRMTETISKIPGLSSRPILRNLFKSNQVDRNNMELVVLVTSGITIPRPPGEAKPMPGMPRDFLTPLTPSGIEEPFRANGTETGTPSNKGADSDRRDTE
jgi:hypothetical protein